MPQRLAQHLISRGLLPARTVDEAMRKLAQGGASLDTLLLTMGAISEAGMLQALADVSGLRLVNLSDFEPNHEVAPLLPLKISRRLSVVPLSVEASTLHLAVSYPVPQKELREVSFLLGKQLELWVALECRIRDWQTSLYGEPLNPRFEQLLKQLDPMRKAQEPQQVLAVTESLSLEVLERIAQGINDEPVLLDRPKKRPPANAVREMTSVAGAAYQTYAKEPKRVDSGEFMETAVLDTTGYADFAREVSRRDFPASTPQARKPSKPLPPMPAITPVAPSKVEAKGGKDGLSFPGGVMPPRTSRPSEPVQAVSATHKEVRAVERAFLQPAVPQKPAAERVHVPPPKPDAETDFSGLDNPTPRPVQLPVGIEDSRPPLPPEKQSVPQRPAVPPPPPPPPPLLTAAKPEAAGAAAPIPPPPPSAPMAAAPSIAPVVFGGAPPPYATPAGPPAEWTLAQARGALKSAVTDRDKLVAVVLDYARRAFEYVAAFAVVRGAAYGWDARGDGDLSAIRNISVPLDAASVFRTVALTRGSYVGPLPPDALTQHYLASLGRAPRTVFLWPVEVKARLVAVIYGDSGTRPVSQRKLSDFILFCQELPSSFHELIAFRKQQGAGQPFVAEVSPDAQDTLPPEAPSEPIAPPAAPEGDDQWFSGLLTLLTGPDARERAEAMSELLKTPTLSARALAKAFPGPTAWSRLPVVELPEADELGPVSGAMARLGRAGALALAPLLDADDSDTRYLALLAAGTLKQPELLDGVMRGLFDYEPDISSAARAAATAFRGVVGFDASMRQLRQELASRDPLRRSLAARALGVLHDREAIEGLIGLTGSDDQLCAQSAADALREICRQNFGNATRQWLAWYAAHREERRIEWLVDALMSEEFDLRLAAVEELSRAVGDNLGFFADGPEKERRGASERWNRLVLEKPEFDV